MDHRVARPAHELISQDSKLGSREWLSEDVRNLVLGGDVLDVDELGF